MEQLSKEKQWKGFAKKARGKLEHFLKEGYSLNKFIDRLEHQRQFLINTSVSNIGKVNEKKRGSRPYSSESFTIQ